MWLWKKIKESETGSIRRVALRPYPMTIDSVVVVVVYKTHTEQVAKPYPFISRLPPPPSFLLLLKSMTMSSKDIYFKMCVLI